MEQSKEDWRGSMVSPGKQVGLRVDVQGGQPLHCLQHVDGVWSPWFKETNVSVNTGGK